MVLVDSGNDLPDVPQDQNAESFLTFCFSGIGLFTGSSIIDSCFICVFLLCLNILLRTMVVGVNFSSRCCLMYLSTLSRLPWRLLRFLSALRGLLGQSSSLYVLKTKNWLFQAACRRTCPQRTDTSQPLTCFGIIFVFIRLSPKFLTYLSLQWCKDLRLSVYLSLCIIG